MKILVEGRKKVKLVRRFECGTCGCIFLADRQEYRTIEGATLMEDGVIMPKSFLSLCPNCDSPVRTARDEEIIEED